MDAYGCPSIQAGQAWFPGVAPWQQQRKAFLAQWWSTAWWSALGNSPIIYSHSLIFSRWISTTEEVKLVAQVLFRPRGLFIVVFYSHAAVTTCGELRLACSKPLLTLLHHSCLLMGLRCLLPFMCIIFLYLNGMMLPLAPLHRWVNRSWSCSQLWGLNLCFDVLVILASILESAVSLATLVLFFLFYFFHIL